MYVIDAAIQVLLVAETMLPEAALPDVLLCAALVGIRGSG